MARFEFEETVKLTVDRVAGTNNDTCSVFASSSTAAIKGLCWLTEEVAKELNMSAEEVVCRLAVVLFGQGKERPDGKDDI